MGQILHQAQSWLLLLQLQDLEQLAKEGLCWWGRVETVWLLLLRGLWVLRVFVVLWALSRFRGVLLCQTRCCLAALVR